MRFAYFCFCGLSRFYRIDPNRNAVLRFNLPDRHGAICAVEHPFNQTALRVAGTISKLWHSLQVYSKSKICNEKFGVHHAVASAKAGGIGGEK